MSGISVADPVQFLPDPVLKKVGSDSGSGRPKITGSYLGMPLKFWKQKKNIFLPRYHLILTTIDYNPDLVVYRIWIRVTQKDRIRPDPEPQHWLL